MGGTSPLLWLALVAACGCARKPKGEHDPWPTVRLGVQRVGPYRAFFVADDKGFFRDERVNVVAQEFPSSNVLGQAQLAGNVDGSGFMSFPVLFSIEQNVAGQSVCFLTLPMSTASRFAAVVVAAGSPIADPAQLRGKKLGVYPSSTNVIFAHMMVEKLFGAEDAAEIIQVDPANALPMLVNGQVDALIGPDPMPATAVARGIGRVLVYAPDAHYVMDPMPVGCATFARPFYDAHPDAVHRVQRAMERAVDYLRDPVHHDEVAAIFARRAGVDQSVVAKLGDLDYWKLTETDRPAVQRLADLLEQHEVLTRHVDTAVLYPEP